MSPRYTIIQITAQHVHRYTNVSPRDIGLWCYLIDGRPYGFSPSKEGAIALAEAAVGTIN